MTDPRIEADPDGEGQVLRAFMSVILPEKAAALAESDSSIARRAGRSEAHDPSTVIDTGAVSVFVDNEWDADQVHEQGEPHQCVPHPRY